MIAVAIVSKKIYKANIKIKKKLKIKKNGSLNEINWPVFI